MPCKFQFSFLKSLLIFPEGEAAAKLPNLRISASGNTQYELTQGINSPWARRFTLDPMGRLPSTRQWVLVSAPRRSLLLRLCRKGRHRRPTPLDPNRGLYPCTQHT